MHADLGIALAKQAWLARADLRLVIMSATLDATRVSAYLDHCPIVEVPGTLHPLDVRYAPDVGLPDAVHACLRERAGQVLCFLPGAGEIARARRELAADAEIVELHGSLDASAQDAAIAPASRRRVILATNIAETSLTVPGVAAVVDTGLHKVARYDPDRAVDSLETERISQDAADQRAGRAARLGPGIVIRLWHRADRLRAHREPEIQRVDLSGTVLDILAWGGDPGRSTGSKSRLRPRGRGVRAPRPPRRDERRPADRRRTPHAAPSPPPSTVGDPARRDWRSRGGGRLRPVVGTPLSRYAARTAIDPARKAVRGDRPASDDDERPPERCRARARPARSRAEDGARSPVSRRRKMDPRPDR